MPTLARVFCVLYNAVYGLEQDKSISSELRTSVKSLKYRPAKALCEEALTMAVFLSQKRKPHEVALSNEIERTKTAAQFLHYCIKSCYNKGSS